MSPVRYGLHLQRKGLAVLCAVLLALGVWPACRASNSKSSLTAIFLVARAHLADPFFAHSIVLVMSNLAAAPVGVIVNRPTPIPVSKLLPGMGAHAHISSKVYFGGPVALGTVWFLFRDGKPHRHAIEVVDGVYLSARASLLSRLLARAMPLADLRVFIGHAGWAPGQLQAEIRAGDWTVRSVRPAMIFGHRGEYPWPPPTQGALRPAHASGVGRSGSPGFPGPKHFIHSSIIRQVGKTSINRRHSDRGGDSKFNADLS